MNYDQIEAPGLTESEFTELYASLVAAFVPNAEISINGPLQFAVKLSSENSDPLEAQMNLENIWSICKDKPGQRLQIIEDQIAKLREITSATSEIGRDVTERVVPLLRRTDELEKLNQGLNNMLVHHSIGADLSALYGINTPHAVGYLTLEQRRELGWDDDALLERAVENLKSILGGQITIMGGPELWGIACGSEYESSLLLNKKLMNNFQDMVKGKMIISVPARDLLMVCGEDSSSAVEEMTTLAKQSFATAAHPVSKSLYYYDDSELSVFRANEG